VGFTPREGSIPSSGTRLRAFRRSRSDGSQSPFLGTPLTRGLHPSADGSSTAAGEPRALVSDPPTKLDAENARCEPDPMTQAAKKLLDEFDALPDRDRSELVAELVRRVALAPHDLPQGDDLVAAADRLFIELDRRERPE
jgi:hypothetical protein